MSRNESESVVLWKQIQEDAMPLSDCLKIFVTASGFKVELDGEENRCDTLDELQCLVHGFRVGRIGKDGPREQLARGGPNQMQRRRLK